MEEKTELYSNRIFLLGKFEAMPELEKKKKITQMSIRVKNTIEIVNIGMPHSAFLLSLIPIRIRWYSRLLTRAY